MQALEAAVDLLYWWLRGIRGDAGHVHSQVIGNINTSGEESPGYLHNLWRRWWDGGMSITGTVAVAGTGSVQYLLVLVVQEQLEVWKFSHEYHSGRHHHNRKRFGCLFVQSLGGGGGNGGMTVTGSVYCVVQEQPQLVSEVLAVQEVHQNLLIILLWGTPTSKDDSSGVVVQSLGGGGGNGGININGSVTAASTGSGGLSIGVGGSGGDGGNSEMKSTITAFLRQH